MARKPKSLFQQIVDVPSSLALRLMNTVPDAAIRVTDWLTGRFARSYANQELSEKQSIMHQTAGAAVQHALSATKAEEPQAKQDLAIAEGTKGFWKSLGRGLRNAAIGFLSAPAYIASHPMRAIRKGLMIGLSAIPGIGGALITAGYVAQESYKRTNSVWKSVALAAAAGFAAGVITSIPIVGWAMGPTIVGVTALAGAGRELELEAAARPGVSEKPNMGAIIKSAYQEAAHTITNPREVLAERTAMDEALRAVRQSLPKQDSILADPHLLDVAKLYLQRQQFAVRHGAALAATESVFEPMMGQSQEDVRSGSLSPSQKRALSEFTTTRPSTPLSPNAAMAEHHSAAAAESRTATARLGSNDQSTTRS